MVMKPGQIHEWRFEGISPNAAYQIGRFATTAILLNERANSAWVKFTEIKVGFEIYQDAEIGLFGVYIKLLNTERVIQRQLDRFSYREDAERFIEVAQKLIADNPQ